MHNVERTTAEPVEILVAREVPLGGPRAMTVRRTLPQRRRSLVGAWCFADHFGPDEVATTGGMRVPPHPHTGLQTVSWLFTGEIEHRDSAGNHALVRPGELNLMTAGRGISHSEVSTSGSPVLHGVQLWVALPDAARSTEPGFEHHVPPTTRLDGGEARVFLGSAFGETSPVRTFTPLLGVEILLAPDTPLDLPLDPGFEHGVLVDTGEVRLPGTGEGARPGTVDVGRGSLAYLAPGRAGLRLTAGTDGVRLLLLGGPPFGEEIVMWWNFLGRSHDEIVVFREQWQALLSGDRSTPFALPDGDPLPPLPAPVLPAVRLRPRT